MQAAERFSHPTARVNQLGQTDFTYLKVIGWSGLYLSTRLDDDARYVMAWKLSTTMKAEAVTDTLNMALKASGCDRAGGVQQPRLRSGLGSSYLSGDLAEWLGDRGIQVVRSTPHYPQTQGKSERWHPALNNRVLLENDYLPGDLEAGVGAFAAYDNHHCYHESLANLTPADGYFGRDHAIIERRGKIKNLTIRKRRLVHHKQGA